IQNRKWPTIVSLAKANRASLTAGKNQKNIHDKKQNLLEKLSHLKSPEIIHPSFSIESGNIRLKNLMTIIDGTIGYKINQCLIENIYLSVSSKARIAIRGDNGTGKSSLIKAILNYPSIVKTGHWEITNKENIGYLDQHYKTLNETMTVIESLLN